MGRSRRTSEPPGGVRDCLDHRAVDVVGRSVVGGNRQPKAGLWDRNAAVGPVGHAKPENTQEMLRHLPYALGGYRLPASADPVPGARMRADAHRAIAADLQPLNMTLPNERDQRRTQSNPRYPPHPAGARRSPNSKEPTEVRDPGRQRADGMNAAAWLPIPEQHGGFDPSAGRRMRSEGAAVRSPGDGQRSSPSRDGRIGFVSKAMEPNSQFRAYMEDRYVAVDPYMPGECGGEQWGFFAVYDGHGGSQAATLCEAELHKVLSVELRTCLRPGSPLADEMIANALVRTFQRVDDLLKKQGAHRYGTTATVALARRSPLGVRMHVANVGDSRAIAVDERGAWRLSQDHRPTDPSEARRIQSGGGFVAMGRVSGELAVSRALGDHHLKNAGLTCVPHISVRDGTTDDVLVIASDGLWDSSMTESDVRATVVQCKAAHRQDQVAPRLVEDAKRRGSTDNIACLAVFL